MRIILIAAASVLASAALAQTSPPPNDTQQVSGNATGDWRKTWKLGPDRYAFEGVSGGCHYSGTVTPSGYHYDRSC
ncbi:MAG: hypothetical protein ACREC1_00910 [Methylovirgula sp.]